MALGAGPESLESTHVAAAGSYSLPVFPDPASEDPHQIRIAISVDHVALVLGLPLHAGGPSRFPVRRFAHEGRYFGRFNAVRTSRIADSIDDMGRKAEMAGMWLGTRSKRANLPATRRERRLLVRCCDNQRRIPPQPRLAQEARKLQGRPPGKQSGSSAAPRCPVCVG